MKSLKSDEKFQQSLQKSDSIVKDSFLVEASKRWKELSEQEKEPYYKENRRQKDRYEMYCQALARFKAENRKEGDENEDEGGNDLEDQI